MIKTFLRKRNTYVLVSVIVILVGTVGALAFHGRARDVATSVLASGLVSIFYLYDRFVSDGNEDRLKVLDRAGVQRVYPSRREIDYATVMKKAHRQVDVVGYSLRAFTDAHAEVVAAKAEEGVSARILVVDPQSEAAREQEASEGYDAGTLASGVQRVVKRFGGLKPAVEVRQIRHAVPEMIFRIDDVMWVGPYFSTRSSATTLTWELDDRDGWLFRQYAEEFDALWENATEVPAAQGASATP